MERIPPPNTSNDAPDQTETADHIFMKISPEVHWVKEVSIAIWKSSIDRRPCQAPALLAPAQIIFLVLILEMWLSMTADFLNTASQCCQAEIPALE